MVLRPSVGSFVTAPHSKSHEKGNDDELSLRNLDGYSELKLHKDLLDSMGLSLERQVQREIDLGSHPDPDGSVRLVAENKGIYKRILGEWVRVDIATTDRVEGLEGKVSMELIPQQSDDWVEGAISDTTGANDNTRTSSIRMKASKPITKGQVYTLSDNSVYASSIGEIWLIEYDGNTFKRVTKIPRGGMKTITAVGTEFRVALLNFEGVTVLPRFFDEPDKRIAVQLVKGRQRSDSTIDQSMYATKKYVDTNAPEGVYTHDGGKNLLVRSRSEVVDATSGRNYETLRLERLPIGEYVISFEYEIVKEVNNIGYFLLYQGGASIGGVPLTTYNGRTYFKFNIEEKHFQNSTGLLIYAGESASGANPNHVTFRNVMVERGSVASIEYTASDEAGDDNYYGGTSILQYSHLVTGTNDWSAALQSALEDSDSVFLPAGTYNITKSIALKEGQTVYGEGKATQINSSVTYLFNAAGSIDDERRITERITPDHGKTMRLDSTSGLKVGDWLMLRSASNCLMPEGAGEEWLLGSGTGTGLDKHQRLPYGEFVCIQGISGRDVTITDGTVYPEYNPTPKSSETYPAKTHSTAAKVNFVSDVTVRDLAVNVNRGGYALRGFFAKDMVMDNVHVDNSKYTSGYTGIVLIQQSLGCQVRNSSYYIPTEKTTPTYYQLNVFKIVSSQRCGFVNCKAENAEQTVDFSFIASYMPNTQCYVKDCSFYGARTTGITTHGGNYLTTITGNFISGTSQGIGTRGRGGLIANNVLIGDSKPRNSNYNYGIATYQGGSGDTIIANNVIRGFGRGYQHLDEGATPRRIGFSGTILQGNTISECRIPVHLFRMWTGPVKWEYMGIQIKDNLIKMQNNPEAAAQSGIFVGRSCLGVKITQNVIRGLEGSPFDSDGKRTNNYTGVTFEGDNNDCSVTDNTFINIDTGVRHHGILGDSYSMTFPGNAVNYTSRGNEYIAVRFRGNIDSSVRDSSNTD